MKRITLRYRLRRWLFLKLMPKNLGVYIFKGIEDAEGTGLLDLDTWRGWGRAKIVRAKGTFIISEYEVPSVSPER